jgi:hypothetical protein
MNATILLFMFFPHDVGTANGEALREQAPLQILYRIDWREDSPKDRKF